MSENKLWWQINYIIGSTYKRNWTSTLENNKIVNNLSGAFNYYKGISKSWNSTVNAPERVEISKKTTQTSSVVKRGRVATTKRDNAPNKHPRKEKTRHFQKTVHVNQPMVDRHLVDNNIPQSSIQVRYINENARTSKNPDDLVFGNHETSKEI
jgi:hypothetical protein